MGGHFLIRRNAAKLDGGTDILADLLLEVLKLALGGHEISGNLIREQCVAGGFEFLDLGFAKLDSGALLVTEVFAALMDALVLEAGGIVTKEPLHLGLKLKECRIGHDLGAEFFGFRNDGGFFGNG